MIVTITPNPALDLTYDLKSLSRGHTIRTRSPAIRAGGKGLNVARVAHQLGQPVLAIAYVGGPTGVEFREELTASGIPHQLLSVDGSTRRTVAIFDAESGETTILCEPGTTPIGSQWEAFLRLGESAMRAADCVVVSGSLPPGLSPTYFADMVERGHAHGARVIVDTHDYGLIAAAEAGADLLKPNREELRAATGESDPVHGAQVLLRKGARIVLVSLGADGMLALSSVAPERPIRAQLVNPLTGNPTGAGDAAVAAAATLLRSRDTDLAELVRSAVAWSAAAVLEPTAGSISDAHHKMRLLVRLTSPRCERTWL